MEIEDEGIGIVIEVKYPGRPDSGRKPEKAGDAAEKSARARDEALEKGCLEALAQIEDLGYDAQLTLDGMDTIIKYGIACDRKRCRVMAVT